MTTKVRITRGRNGNYDSLTMEIFQTDADRPSLLNHVGSITWQGDSKHQWYAMHFNCEAELQNHRYLLTMYKLAAYVKERISQDTPIEVMGIIGGDEHFFRHGMFISLSDNGKQMYDVLQGSALQCRIVAANMVMADRIVEGMLKRNELNGGPFTIRPVGERLQFSPTNLAY